MRDNILETLEIDLSIVSEKVGNLWCWPKNGYANMKAGALF